MRHVDFFLGSTIFLLTTFCQKTVNAQNRQFTVTQYMDNVTPFNPAFALKQGASLSMTGRRQWVGIEGAPSTYLLNGNLPINSINAIAGLVVANDVYTIEHQTEVNLFFAKAIKLNDEFNLGVAINGGLRNYTANYSSLSAIDVEFKDDIRETTPNIGFGVMLYSERYFLGLSIPELNVRTLGIASQQSKTDFNSHYYFTAGYNQNISDDIKIKYATLMGYAKTLPLTVDLSGLILLKNQFGIGANLRSSKEVAGIFNINIDRFSIGYSYQLGSNSVSSFSNATQELCLGIKFDKSNNQ